jgi:hypothetical protein
MSNFDLKKYLAENKLNEAEGNDLYTTAGQMISQVGLFTQKNADEMEADGSGNLYRFFKTPEEKAELIKISEAYPAYLSKVKAMMDELMNDPMYQVAVGDAGRNSNPLEKAYYRAKNTLNESYQSNIGMYEEEFKKRGFKRTNEEYSEGGYQDLWYKDFPLGRFCVSIVTFDLASGIRTPKHQQFTYNIFFEPYPKFETKLFGLLKTKKHQFGKMINFEEGVIDFGEGLFKVEDEDFIPGFFAKVDTAEKIASKITDVEYLSHEDSKSWKRMAFPDVNE